MSKILKLAKSPNPTDEELLANKLLPIEIEELYIEFTNELLNYASILQKQQENNRMLTNNSLCLIHMSDEIKAVDQKNQAEKEKIKSRSMHLKIKRTILHKNVGVYKRELDESLAKMKDIILKISNGKSIYDLEDWTSDNLVVSYVNLRKSCYKFIEGIGTHIIKKEKLDKKDQVLLEIAIKSLELFDLNEIINDESKASDIGVLMNLISEYLSSRRVNFQKLSSLNNSLDKSKYSSLLLTLNEIYKKEISPLTFQ